MVLGVYKRCMDCNIKMEVGSKELHDHKGDPVCELCYERRKRNEDIEPAVGRLSGVICGKCGWKMYYQIEREVEKSRVWCMNEECEGYEQMYKLPQVRLKPVEDL